MTRLLAVAATAVGLFAIAACAAPVSPPPAQSIGAITGETTGEIRIEEGGTAGGPGVSIAEALAADITEPVLVNGILLQDTDGVIWLCSALLESSPPGCGLPKLKVVNFPPESGELDPANAQATGLQQDGGVVWIESYQLFGTAEPGL